jgi:hypothetical protein
VLEILPTGTSTDDFVMASTTEVHTIAIFQDGKEGKPPTDGLYLDI